MYTLHVIVSICNLWTKQQVYLLVAVPRDLWASSLARLRMFCSLLPEKGKDSFHVAVWGWEMGKEKENTTKPAVFTTQGLFWTFCWERLGPPHWESGRSRAELLPHGFGAETQSYQDSEMHRAQPRGCMKVTLTWDTGTLAQHLLLWVPRAEVTVCEVLPIAAWPTLPATSAKLWSLSWGVDSYISFSFISFPLFTLRVLGVRLTEGRELWAETWDL